MTSVTRMCSRLVLFRPGTVRVAAATWMHTAWGERCNPALMGDHGAPQGVMTPPPAVLTKDGCKTVRCHPPALQVGAVSYDLEGGGGVVDTNGVGWEVQSDLMGGHASPQGVMTPPPAVPVSYTHLTLPTIYSV